MQMPAESSVCAHNGKGEPAVNGNKTAPVHSLSSDLQASEAWPMVRPSFAKLLSPCDDALVAQLDRAPDYESGGREFESSRARHFLDNIFR